MTAMRLVVAALCLSLFACNSEDTPEPSSPASETLSVPSGKTPQTVVPAVSNGWRRLPDPPLSPRDRATVVETSAGIVVLGGLRPQHCPRLARCPFPGIAPGGAVFDTENETWHRTAPIPREATGAQVGVDDDRVVALGGSFPQRLAIYDVGDDRWSLMPRSPWPQHGDEFLTVADGFAYITPGDDSASAAPIQRLDLATRKWTTLPRSQERPFLGLRRLFATPHGLIVMGATWDRRHQSHTHARAEVLRHGAWHRFRAPGFRASGWEWHWTGKRMIAPFLWNPAHGPGLALDVDSGAWSRLPNQPQRTYGGWQLEPAADDDLVVQNGYLYDDAAQTWSPIKRPDGASRSGAAADVVNGDVYALDSRSHWWLMPGASTAS